MKKKLYLILLIINLLLNVSNCMYSQNLKRKQVKSGPIIEEFTINRDSKLKEGIYTKLYIKTGDTISQGNYKKDNRIGKWKFSYSNLHFSYNYDNHDFKFLNSSCNENFKFYIKDGERFIQSEVERPAIYLDSELDLRFFLTMNTDLPKEITENKIEDYSVASIIVDTIGNFRFYRIEKSISESLDKEIINSISNIPSSFLPAIKNDKNIESKIFIVFNIANENPKIKIESEDYRIIVDLVYFKSF